MLLNITMALATTCGEALPWQHDNLRWRTPGALTWSAEEPAGSRKERVLHRLDYRTGEVCVEAATYRETTRGPAGSVVVMRFDADGATQSVDGLLAGYVETLHGDLPGEEYAAEYVVLFRYEPDLLPLPGPWASVALADGNGSAQSVLPPVEWEEAPQDLIEAIQRGLVDGDGVATGHPLPATLTVGPDCSLFVERRRLAEPYLAAAGPHLVEMWCEDSAWAGSIDLPPGGSVELSQ